VKRERSVVIAECERLERAVGEMVEDRLARQRLALDYEYLGEHEKSAEQWSILIDKEIELGHVDNALTALEKKIKIHPTDFEAHEKRIQVAARGLRGDIAIRYGVVLARLYARYGFTNRAFGLYEKIIEWAPSNVEARRGFAELAMETGNLKAALEHLREVATELEKDGAGETLEEVYSELIKLDTTDSAARSFLRDRAAAQLSWFRRRGPFVLCLLLILLSIGFVVADTHSQACNQVDGTA
jgi:tetratricopeptide (TPR) repeat protein